MEVMGTFLITPVSIARSSWKFPCARPTAICTSPVEDDGPGIPQSQRRAVFDRGQRAGYPASRRVGSPLRVKLSNNMIEIIAGKACSAAPACMEVVFGRQQMEDKQS